MKRNTILAIIAIALLAIGFGPYLLLLLPIIPIAYFIIKRKERTEVPRVTYATVEETMQRYGEPDDVVVLDASRANELPALILFYPNRDLAIIAGEELKLSSLYEFEESGEDEHGRILGDWVKKGELKDTRKLQMAGITLGG